MKQNKNIEATASTENKKAANAEVTNLETASTDIKKVSKKDKKKSKVKETKEVKAEKKKKKVTTEVAKQQKSAIIEEVVSKREVKYVYPDDVTDSLSRKTWRQKVRNQLHKLERDMYRIKDTNSKEYKKALKEFETFRDQVLKPEQIA